MTDVTVDSGTSEASPPVAVPAAEGAISPRDAARALSQWRHQKEQTPEPAAEAAPEQESTPEGEDAAPPQEVPGETQEAEPAELPLIEPPRSWTKEEKEEFATYPREAQEKIARREQERDAATRRSQNEAAEKLKGLTVKEQAVEQARQQYESALPILMQNLQTTMAGEFADIKTMADVQKMAAEDWPRYIRWDAAQKQVAAVHQEIIAAQQRQQTETQTKFAEFAKREGELFLEKVPEMADPAKAAELQKAAVASLKSAGFEEGELADAWQGKANVPFRDHRVQLIIHKAALWDQAQTKAKAINTQAKPVPPVQRPGAAQPKGAAQAATITNLENKLKGATGIKAVRIAADLVKAKRAASR